MRLQDIDSENVRLVKSIRFTVYGKPATAGSKHGIAYKGKDGKQHVAVVADNKRAKPWMAIVHEHAQTAMGDRPMFTGAVRLDLDFMFVRPKCHYRTGKLSHILKPDAPKFHTKTPDRCKLERCTEDAMKRVVWLDDSQVVGGEVTKRWADREGVVITITPLE